MANYAAEITYARINANNNALASSNDGNGDGSGASISEVIEAPTHSGYFVSGTPSGPTVVADASVDTVFEVGQYLFYWDLAGNPVLIGQIESLSTSTITLTSTIIGNGGDMTNQELGVAYSLITPNEQFYIRVKTTKTSTTTSFILMPNFQEWRKVKSQRNESAIIESQSNIQQYSNIGNPISIDGVNPYVNFKVVTMNTFLSSNNGVTYFANWAQFPRYIWLRATVIPSDATASALSASTMYRLTTNEFMDNAITVTANTANAILYDAGYNIVKTTSASSQNTGGN